MVNELVSKGNVNVNLKDALEDLHSIYSRGNPVELEVLSSIFEDIFRPYIHSRLYGNIMQELRSHNVFQAYNEKMRQQTKDDELELKETPEEVEITGFFEPYHMP